MPEKFRNKYRIDTIRLKNYDYSANGYYFITICTKNRLHYFGKIIDQKMELSEIGKIAHKCWLEIPNHFPFVILDEFAIMPNHIHGIVIINKKEKRQSVGVETPVEAQDLSVEAQDFVSPPSSPVPPPQSKNTFGPQSKNLASIIRGFKVGVKKYATINNIDFAWQSKYYEHIVRNEKALNRIRQYIQNNPLNWVNDKNN